MNNLLTFFGRVHAVSINVVEDHSECRRRSVFQFNFQKGHVLIWNVCGAENLLKIILMSIQNSYLFSIHQIVFLILNLKEKNVNPLTDKSSTNILKVR